MKVFSFPCCKTLFCDVRYNVWFLFIIPSFLFSQNMEINLNQNWQFRKAGDSVWYPASVPGCVHTDLLANHLISDPFYSDNEKLVQWIENEEWEYQTIFLIDKKALRNEFIEIQFEGLDTYAEVFLNDTLILKADNMFRNWDIDIKKYLKLGDNKLFIKFSSAVRVGKELMNNYPVKLPGEERVFTRKAQYQYGWDWGPRLVTSGIWKNVSLKLFDENYLIIKGIKTLSCSTDSAEVSLEIFNATSKSAKCKLKIIDKETGKFFLKKKVTLTPQSNAFKFTIKAPKLWWSSDLGNPNLYHAEVQLSSGLKHIHSEQIQFGIRDIQLIQNADSLGKSFYFQLNNIPVFAKGANIIPLHSFSPSVKKEDYKNLLLEAKAMHINMLRVWGGGIYEDEYFYELCDSLGIMIWQDFMYAGGMYPFNMLESNALAESTFQYQRISQHPSVVLFCGNNEIDEGWNNWGWQKQFNYNQQDSEFVWQQYERFFHSDIPLKVIDKHLPQFHPSSPTHGWGRKESLIEGDAHYWGVWWGKEPFDVYNNKIPRFMSEYGFQALPCFNSFKQFIPENELYGTVQEILQRPSIKNHQKHLIGFETILEYMARDYHLPTDFEDFIYVSQLLQAEGMKTAIEAHRRNQPYCMGTLFWQLNDCWPVTSWSTIDYYGNRKASYYAVKETYQQVIFSAINENDSLKIYLVNDLLHSIQDNISLRLYSMNGELVSDTMLTPSIQSQSSTLIFSEPIVSVLKNKQTSDVFLHIVSHSDTFNAEKYYYFTNPKSLNLPKANYQITYSEDLSSITIKANSFLKDIYLSMQNSELNIEQNFFTMLQGTSKTIKFESPLSEKDLQSLRIKTLNEINFKYQ